MIGIVGNGFVGNAVYQNFRDKHNVRSMILIRIDL